MDLTSESAHHWTKESRLFVTRRRLGQQQVTSNFVGSGTATEASCFEPHPRTHVNLPLKTEACARQIGAYIRNCLHSKNESRNVCDGDGNLICRIDEGSSHPQFSICCISNCPSKPPHYHVFKLRIAKASLTFLPSESLRHGCLCV